MNGTTSAVPLLHDYLAESARRLPEKIALVAGDARLTYAELDRRANALAATLARRGVGRGIGSSCSPTTARRRSSPSGRP